MIEKRVTGGVFGDVVTQIRYNDNGYESEEKTARTPTPEASTEFSLDEAGNMTPVRLTEQTASRGTTHYAYEYDQQGNWTRKTVSVRSEPDGEFKVSMSIHRVLTYY